MIDPEVEETPKVRKRASLISFSRTRKPKADERWQAAFREQHRKMPAILKDAIAAPANSAEAEPHLVVNDEKAPKASGLFRSADEVAWLQSAQERRQREQLVEDELRAHMLETKRLEQLAARAAAGIAPALRAILRSSGVDVADRGVVVQFASEMARTIQPDECGMVSEFDIEDFLGQLGHIVSEAECVQLFDGVLGQANRGSDGDRSLTRAQLEQAIVCALEEAPCSAGSA
jgi:hypothetical protein